jgi:hypothetical protein
VIDEVAEVATKATAWHGWLWRIRVAQARAEIASRATTGRRRSSGQQLRLKKAAGAGV